MTPQHTLERALKEAGWTFVRQGKHRIWRCGCGRHTLTAPGSVGRGSSTANTLADMRRLNRQCSEGAHHG